MKGREGYPINILSVFFSFCLFWVALPLHIHSWNFNHHLCLELPYLLESIPPHFQYIVMCALGWVHCMNALITKDPGWNTLYHCLLGHLDKGTVCCISCFQWRVLAQDIICYRNALLCFGEKLFLYDVQLLISISQVINNPKKKNPVAISYKIKHPHQTTWLSFPWTHSLFYQDGSEKANPLKLRLVQTEF